MKIVGIEGVRRGRRTTVTTVRDEGAPRHPDHIKRRWSWPTRPDQWWVADFVRHEALFDRAVVKGHRLRLVAAGWTKLRAA